MFPTGWTGKLEIQSDSTKVSGSSDLSNFPALISDSNLSSVVYAGLNTAELNDQGLLNDANLQAYYRFESNGNDSSGNSRTLTSVGTPAYNTGQFGNSLDVPGTANYFYYNGDIGLTGNGSASISCWVKLDAEIGSGSYTIFQHEVNTGTARYLTFYYEYNGGTRRLRIDASGSSYYYNVTLGTTNWNHFTVVRTTTTSIKVYMNGVEIISNTPGSAASGALLFRIGSNAASHLNGRIDDLAVFNRVLTIDEIKSLYRGGSDLRITTDSAGTTEVPFEIVSLDTVAETCEIWAKVPTLSYNSPTSLYCYSPDTDILTKDGWVNIKDYVENKLTIPLATLNPDKQLVEYHKPQQLIKKKHTGKMFHQTGKGIDFLVTPEHRVWAKRLSQDDFELIRADEVPKNIQYQKHFPYEGEVKDKIMIPGFTREYSVKDCLSHYAGKLRKKAGYDTEYVFENKFLPTKEFLRVFGIWLADGSLRRHSVVITQKKQDSKKKIIKWIEELGYKPTIIPDGVLFHDTQLVEWLKQFGHAKDKFIPREILNLDKKHLKYLLEGLLLGDGSVRDRDMYYASISDRLIDNVQELAIKCGYSTSISYKISGFGSRVIVLGISKSKTATPYNPKKPNQKWIEYDGMVYCVGVTNHIVFTRRNGKACWNGNCWYGNSSALPYSATDTYGSQNVWTGDQSRCHLEGNSIGSTSTGYTGTDSNVTYSTANGNFSQGAGFAGNGYIETNSALKRANNTTNSLSFWFKTTQTTDNALYTEGSTTSNNPYYSLDVNAVTQGKVGFFLRNLAGTSAQTLSTTATFNDGNWHYVVLTKNSSSFVLYVDGSSEATLTSSLVPETNSFGFGAFNRATKSNYLTGAIDEFRFHDGVLTSDWITTEYNNQNSPSTFWTQVTGVTFTPSVMIF